MDDDIKPNFESVSKLFKEDSMVFKTPSRENEYVIERGRQKPASVW